MCHKLPPAPEPCIAQERFNRSDCIELAATILLPLGAALFLSGVTFMLSLPQSFGL